jgi:hypothetical protein
MQAQTKSEKNYMFFSIFLGSGALPQICGGKGKWEESGGDGALIKKKIKFSSFIRKFSMEQLQSHI